MVYGPEHEFATNPKIKVAFEKLFILHAEHELNCSTAAIRHMESSVADVYTSVSGAVTALYGPRHGGANEAVINMLEEIKHPDYIEGFIQRAKDKNDTFRLMGFGHRVYKNYDPRAAVLRTYCHELLEELNIKDDKLLIIALQLEKIALKDEYFIEKKLFPNVDF